MEVWLRVEKSCKSIGLRDARRESFLLKLSKHYALHTCQRAKVDGRKIADPGKHAPFERLDFSR